MAYGLQLWDAQGNLTLDTSHSVLRIIASVSVVGGSGGSVYDTRMASGGWVAFQPDNYNGYLSGGLIRPQFSFSGGTLTWTYAAKKNGSYDIYAAGTAFYGAY